MYVLNFYHEQGVDYPEHVEDPESRARVIEFTRRREHVLESQDPLRIRITMPGEDAELHVTLDENLEVIDTKQEDRETV